jgi:hypothetical protein
MEMLSAAEFSIVMMQSAVHANPEDSQLLDVYMYFYLYLSKI